MRLLAAAALVVTLLVPRSGAAQERQTLTHEVKAGDSLQLLAAEYYGDRRYAVFIMVENKLTHPRPLKPGERLRIPVEHNITAAVGDTLEAVAAEYLGDIRRAPFLAEFNNLPPDTSAIAAGQRITIPFHVTHVAAARETLDSIGAAYFGDPRQGKMIQQYNFTSADALEPGQSIVIPIYHVRVRASKLPPPDAKSAAREAKLREMQDKAQQVLPEARAAWRAGDYTTVKRELTQLDSDYLETELAAEVGVLLGSAYIAFDDLDSALARFQKVLERKPKHALSAYDVSPKIRQVWQRAGGAVEPAP